MIPLSDIHTHTVFSDGKNTPEEMALAAIDRGFVSIGFSEHAWTPYDTACCIKKENISRYFDEIARLKSLYADKIEIYTGFETDCHEHTPKDGLDYTIGSAHYLYDAAADEHYTFDHLPALFEKGRDLVAGGDVREMVRIYYGMITSLAENRRPDVIGHLDLITKLNKDSRYFDQNAPWYVNLMGETAEKLAASGCIVEVNTGGIFRGYKDRPYPSREFLGLLREAGTPVMLSSDAHCTDALAFWFDEAVELLRDTCYKSVRQLRGGGFIEVEL